MKNQLQLQTLNLGEIMSSIKNQIDQLIDYCPNLKIIKADKESYVLEGNVFINAQNTNIQLADDFDIEIIIFKDFPNKIPKIKEKSGKIPANFEHINSDGTLCLAIDTEILIYLKKVSNLVEWFKKYVVDFFYTVMYFDRYDTFPYGERRHGLNGIIQFYQEYFVEKNIFAIWSLLRAINEGKIKGHHLCPCGSKVNCRKCHFEKLIKICRNRRSKKRL